MTVRGAVWVLARSCHPEPTVAVTVLATAYAALAGAGARTPLVGAAVLSQQLSIGWSNDALDTARDRADGRRDKPLVDSTLSPRTVLAAAVVALAASIPLSRAAVADRSDQVSRAGPVPAADPGTAGPAQAAGRRVPPGAGNLVCAAAGWSYNLGLKATVASPLPYLVGFGGLAAFLESTRPGVGRPSPWVVAAGGLLGASAHVVNVLPDIDDDLAHGIRGLPQRLGAARSRRAGALLLAAAGAVLALAPDPLGTPAARVGRAAALTLPAVGLAVVSGRATAGSRSAFRLVLVVAVADVGLFLRRARR